MERLEQYCLEHGWNISLRTDTMAPYYPKFPDMEPSGWPKYVVLTKGEIEVSERFEIAMDIDGMIYKMMVADGIMEDEQLELDFMATCESLF